MWFICNLKKFKSFSDFLKFKERVIRPACMRSTIAENDQLFQRKYTYFSCVLHQAHTQISNTPSHMSQQIQYLKPGGKCLNMVRLK
jgi:hypothetical protein